MDHYRRLENCSLKKKNFGANLVEKVKKAGSELLNKVIYTTCRIFSESQRFPSSFSSTIITCAIFVE